MDNNAVIDLETLSTKNTAAFISVGAVRINLMTGEITDKWYANINMQDAKKHGHVSKSTVEWWKQQSPEARAIFKDNPRPIEEAMYEFSCWLKPNDRVWGNGATFDIAILEHFYQRNTPWKFWNIRDVRTIKEIGEMYFGFNKDSIPFEGTPHNALDDAAHEAKLIYWVHSRIAEANKVVNSKR